MSVALHGQTRYGTDARINYSYFGYYAGNAATTASAYNSFFGAYSGRTATDGNQGEIPLQFSTHYIIMLEVTRTLTR